jgi:hypothetical protein
MSSRPEEELSRLERFFLAHERLKKRIHAYRLPIHTRLGRFAVGCVYFSVPCVIGYFALQGTNFMRDQNLGKNRELILDRKRQFDAEREEERKAALGDSSQARVMAKTPVANVEGVQRTVKTL